MRPLGHARWEVGIHIADVSHYVVPGSALDAEAEARGTSCYLPGGVVPMLPERLPADLCSLREGRDRLALSVFATLDARGVLHPASDKFLGWYTGTGKYGHHYYGRQLRDAKIKPVIEIMQPTDLKGYANLCGRALARAHARSGDAAVLSGYMGKSIVFEEAIADFSVAYADQNERDHAALVEAIRSGGVEAILDQ